MLKSIFTQLWNRKQSNIWIVLELLLVFCLVWYMVDYFFVLSYNYHIPNHRDIRHTWKVNLSQYPEESSNYKAEESETEARATNFTRILQQIQNHPGIEALSVSYPNSTPGSGGYMGTSYELLNDTTLIVGGQIITFDPNYDFFRVFGYTSDNGKKAVSVRDFDWSNPKVIVVSRSVVDRLFPDSSAIGREIRTYWQGKEHDRRVIVGVVDDVKRFDYLRPQNTFYIPQQPDSTRDWTTMEISIRSKSTLPDLVFQENFQKEMMNTLQIGNFYFKNIVPFSEINAQKDREFGQTKDVYIRTALMIFFLLNILLCVIGTFWYRVHVRQEEIGIRKAFGASKINIRNTLLLEGICLLTIVLLPAMLIEFQFVHAGVIDTLGKMKQSELYLPDRMLLCFLITNGITWLLMAAVSVFAIWLPARKAAAMQTVEALHYE